MKKLKIAYTDKALEIFGAIAGREQADLARTDFTDVAAVVITDQDKDVLEKEMIAAFKIPVLMIKTGEGLTEDTNDVDSIIRRTSLTIRPLKLQSAVNGIMLSSFMPCVSIRPFSGGQ